MSISAIGLLTKLGPGSFQMWNSVQYCNMFYIWVLSKFTQTFPCIKLCIQIDIHLVPCGSSALLNNIDNWRISNEDLLPCKPRKCWMRWEDEISWYPITSLQKNQMNQNSCHFQFIDFDIIDNIMQVVPSIFFQLVPSLMLYIISMSTLKIFFVNKNWLPGFNVVCHIFMHLPCVKSSLHTPRCHPPSVSSLEWA